MSTRDLDVIRATAAVGAPLPWSSTVVNLCDDLAVAETRVAALEAGIRALAAKWEAVAQTRPVANIGCPGGPGDYARDIQYRADALRALVGDETTWSKVDPIRGGNTDVWRCEEPLCGALVREAGKDAHREAFHRPDADTHDPRGEGGH